MALSKQLSDPLPDLPLQPVSPPSNFSFPKRDFGKDKVVNTPGFPFGPGYITRLGTMSSFATFALGH